MGGCCADGISAALHFFFKTSVTENVVGSGVGGVIAMGVVVDGTLTVGCLWLGVFGGFDVGVRWRCG
jgi:hypothetical protein